MLQLGLMFFKFLSIYFNTNSQQANYLNKGLTNPNNKI